MTAVAIAIFSAWFVLSLLAQISERALQNFRRYDIFGLIPAYNFFAPTPGTLDYHILVRDQIPDGSLTLWRELPYVPATRYPFIWNPGRRHNKAIFDIMKDLSAWINELDGETDSLYISPPYITVLNYVSSIRRSEPATKTQFMLMSSKRRSVEKDIAPVFLSSVHPLE